MIALIFAALTIFVFGLVMTYPEKQTQRQMDMAHLVTMFGMISLIALACICVIGRYP